MIAHSYLIALPHLNRGVGSSEWWLSSSPLNALIDGSDAVLVFFLLSGLVVTLPVLRPGFRWIEYYPRRVARLYLPVWASLALAITLMLTVSRDDLPGGQWASNASASSLDLWSLSIEALLLTTDPLLNNPLWSLTWEVAFSLLLPLFVWAATVVRRWWITAMIACVLLRVTGNALDIAALAYLPVFLLGTIAATKFSSIAAAAASINRKHRPALWWSFLAILSLLMLTATPTLQGAGVEPGIALSIARQLPLIGAAGVVFIAIGSATALRLLEHPVAQWAGRLSFSLYLVHVPILVTLLAGFGVEYWWLCLMLGVPSSFIVAWGFERIVERPSHRLSKSFGRAIAARY